MNLDNKQLLTLQKLSEKVSGQVCITKEDLIIGIYLPEFWDGEFDDESLYYSRTPEYTSAENVYSQSMQVLLDAGLVEKDECDIHTVRDGQTTSVCYRITEYGRHALDMLR